MNERIDSLTKHHLYKSLRNFANIKIRNIDKKNYKSFRELDLPLHTALKTFIHQSGKKSVLNKEDMLYILLKYDVIDVDLAGLLFKFFDSNSNSDLYSNLSSIEDEMLDYCYVNEYDTDLNAILVSYIFHSFGIEFLYSDIASLINESFTCIDIDSCSGVKLNFDNLLSNYMESFLNNYIDLNEFIKIRTEHSADEDALEICEQEYLLNAYYNISEIVSENIYVFAFKNNIRINYVANMLDWLFANNSEPESHLEEISGVKYLILSDTTLSEYLDNSNALVLIVCMCVLYNYDWSELCEKQPNM